MVCLRGVDGCSEWKDDEVINHGKTAVRGMGYIAEFLVSEARKNKHSFPTQQEELDHLIYHYFTTYTGQIDRTYQECYFF